MYFFLGILFVIAGMIMILKPHIIFDITESWKSSSPVEPSSLYIFGTRFGGVIILLIGIGSIILQFMME